MATNLYAALELEQNATPEQIRKAYKKLALQTHPDRLPSTMSAAEKAASAENFRVVNNAYEVLSDPEKRREYDTTGVWPPPRPSQERHRPRAHRNDDFFYGDPFFTRSSPWASRPRDPFTDPFTLFESMFGESMFGNMNRGFSNVHNMHFSGPPMLNPFMSMGGNFPFGPSMVFPGPGGDPHGMQSRRYSHTSWGATSGQDWVTSTKMTRTVNGVTQSIWQRKDANGNEHVTYTYPDGRERYTVNGIEQQSDRHNPQPLPQPYANNQVQPQPPPFIPQEQDAPPQYSSPPPQYAPPPPQVSPNDRQESNNGASSSRSGRRRWW